MSNDEKELEDFKEKCLFLIWDFVNKKYDLDKKLNEIIEKKFKLAK